MINKTKTDNPQNKIEITLAEVRWIAEIGMQSASNNPGISLDGFERMAGPIPYNVMVFLVANGCLESGYSKDLCREYLDFLQSHFNPPQVPAQ